MSGSKIKIKTLLSASSFIPESNSFWKRIRALVKSIEFMEYGNLILSFDRLRDFDSLVTILFFEDLLLGNKSKGIELLLGNLNNILNSNKLIFFGISFFLFLEK